MTWELRYYKLPKILLVLTITLAVLLGLLLSGFTPLANTLHLRTTITYYKPVSTFITRIITNTTTLIINHTATNVITLTTPQIINNTVTTTTTTTTVQLTTVTTTYTTTTPVYYTATITSTLISSLP
ncbi:hypothetical protein [Caldivirga maquilingensis]|uniref:Uncharacterized protein n=1 Tax=Caldivirga maquilingensis (strain ATCC 700844 / DSM 13496 / JCM 10307 / IC-167) TaxID=397948 RepID=A8MDN3_CALMQ|nr:hypothetical protein [Caldivirga maquilingensis]ABW01889.1 hypothetical protein Cmaq_1060 [Caldivirga maquilingensis IC-167]